MKKIFAILLSLTMIIGLAASAMAAVTTDSGKGGSGEIAITLPKDTAGTDQEITYTIYKVFDATNDGTTSAISYKIDAVNGDLPSDMIAAGFFLDDGGNVHYGTFTPDESGSYVVGGVKGIITDETELDQDAIDAIAAYAVDEIGTFTATPSDGTLTVTGLEYGYYYITTTTGTVVSITSTNPKAETQDKNELPPPPVKVIGEDFEESVDESGKKAIEAVGTTVPFEVTIEVVKGATNYVFHDVMSDGLTYNNDVAVDPAESVDNTTTATGDTVTVTFDNDWLAANEGATITITYTATINDDALTIDYVNNTATLDYGEGNTTDKDEVDIYTAKITVSKEDGDGQALAGAGFVLKNAEGKYYTYTAADGVVWVDSEEDADEHISGDDGAVPAFEGLADGTYTLHESTVPEGYNQAADQEFTINEGDYTDANLKLEATVVNEAGSTLPSTGGIGTTIFYVVGGLLAVGAGVVLVTKKRMGKEEA